VTLPSGSSKNRGADISDIRKAEDLKCARIYNLEAIDLYEKVIPATCECFLPKPISSTKTDKYRYSVKAVRGLRYLQEYMKNLSKKAGLSKVYTNHCIR
jgi:hypothetical protein